MRPSPAADEGSKFWRRCSKFSRARKRPDENLGNSKRKCLRPPPAAGRQVPMRCIGMYFLSPKSTKKCRCSARTKNSICYPALRSGKSNFLYVLAATQRTRAGTECSSPKILDASRGGTEQLKGKLLPRATIGFFNGDEGIYNSFPRKRIKRCPFLGRKEPKNFLCRLRRRG